MLSRKPRARSKVQRSECARDADAQSGGVCGWVLRTPSYYSVWPPDAARVEDVDIICVLCSGVLGIYGVTAKKCPYLG